MKRANAIGKKHDRLIQYRIATDFTDFVKNAVICKMQKSTMK